MALGKYPSCNDCPSYNSTIGLPSPELELIEDFLINKGFDIEDYNDPEREISQLEAIIDILEIITEDAWKYQELCR
jgi:hypothetical protein